MSSTAPLDPPPRRGPAPDRERPERVGDRYRVGARLGGGGMGTVWLGHDEVLGRDVALKQVLTVPGASESERAEQRERALQEGRAAARLRTPHAEAVHDVVLHDGDPWLVLEHVPSRDLAQVVEAEQVLPVAQVAQVGAQVADALADAHAAGVVHRDVKPDNVLVGEGGEADAVVKLADFGIALAPGDTLSLPPGFLAGTPAYLAPEVARGGPSTPASDVFALGATLFVCLEGQPPFGTGGDPAEVVARAARGATLPPAHAGALEPVLARMLADDPADRPTARQARDELAAVAAGRDDAVEEVLAGPVRLVPRSRAAAGITVAAVAGAGVGVAAGAGAAAGAAGAVAGATTTAAKAGGLGAVLTKPWVVAGAALAVVLAGGGAVALTRGAPPPPPPAAVAPAPTVTAATAEGAVRGLATTLLDDPSRALAGAGPDLAAVGPLTAQRYLDRVLDFRLGAVRAQDGGAVSADLTVTRFDGTTTTTPVAFTVSPAGSGVVVDSPQLAGILAAGPS